MTTPEPPPEGRPYHAGQAGEPAPFASEGQPYPASNQPYAAQPYEQGAYPPPQQPYEHAGYPPPQQPYPPAYPPPQPYQYPYPPQYAPAQPTNGMAIASMVLGILWLYWIGSILALIFGYIARKDIQRTGASGDGMAIAGIVLGWVGVGILCVVLIVVAAAAWS